MEEKCFVWDDSVGLTTLGASTMEPDEDNKRHFETAQTSSSTAQSFKFLRFRETLNAGKKFNFRKYYLRKVSPSEADVIILQDIKDLVIYLLHTPVTAHFINFFHSHVVDRFLRTLIIYFQCYIQIWEELMEERLATAKKAINPLAKGHRFEYAYKMQSLRSVLGNEYANLLLLCDEGTQYHHMISGKKQSLVRSQGERDLRTFEALIGMAHRVVWIALQRKNTGLIEVELHRLLRSDIYNTAKRSGHVIPDALESDVCLLQGPKFPSKRRLLRNSPLTQELVYSECDFRILSVGIVDPDIVNTWIIYLQNALLLKEEKFHELGISMGILGQSRLKYDVMLAPIEEVEPLKVDNLTEQVEATKLEGKHLCSGSIMEHLLDAPSTALNEMKKDNRREEARKKWITKKRLSNDNTVD